MTRDDFLEAINFSMKPPFSIEDIHEGGEPDNEGTYLVGTEDGYTFFGIWYGSYWNYVGVTSSSTEKQKFFD